MERHLNLVKSDFERLERLVVPRFPICYLTFKSIEADDSRVFEVKDISYTGMQLGLRDGAHELIKGNQLKGYIHWNGQELEVSGEIQWVTDSRLGLEFVSRSGHRIAVDQFLSTENFLKALKPVHNFDFGVDLPPKLKYWLRSDGPVEIFAWQHSDGELAQFQIIYLTTLVEWQDGKGIQTGRIISKRDVDTPLINEDEFVFSIDEVIDDEKIDTVSQLTTKLSTKHLPEGTLKFIQMKLGN